MVRMVCWVASLVLAQNPPVAVYGAPAGSAYAKVVPGGRTVLPNGRLLTPVGRRLYTGSNAWHVATNPRSSQFAVAYSGGIAFFADSSGRTKPRILSRSEMAPTGRFTPDGKQFVMSLGDVGALEVIDTSTLESLGKIPFPDKGGDRGYANDIAISPDGKTAYVADVAVERILAINLARREVIGQVKAGRQPYALVLDEKGTRLFVANIGIFDYSTIPPLTGEGDKRGLTLPPFAFPSKQSETGLEIEGRFVPGLGSPYVPDAQSVTAFDLVGGSMRPGKTVKTGLLIHAPADGGKAVGGSAPCALVALGKDLWVANANNDTVQVFRQADLKLTRTTKLLPEPSLSKLRGVIPSGLVSSPDGKTMYVSESGTNSVAAVSTTTGKVKGRFPVGWFPVGLAWADGGRTLLTACQKGLGLGPRGHLDPRPASDERFGMTEMPGFVLATECPTDGELKAGVRTVAENNGLLPRKPSAEERKPNPVPLVPGRASEQIKYVVFITKENHTFDGIFGGLPGAKSRPEYAEWGINGWIRENGQAERVRVMPNHVALAERWAISDNFYMEPQASGDGHRWLIGVYPSLWTTRVFYSGWDFRPTDSAKGRLVSMSSNGSQIPEDYLENGSMWEHLARGGVTFRNYGEGFEFPGQMEPEDTPRSGSILVANHPLNKALWANTCWNYPVYNNAIPDIARETWFEEDIEATFRKPGKPLPRFMNITLCNDHGSSPEPKSGYPYVSSFMADNDLALGRMIEYLSRQPEWKNMAVFVTQDDSGGDSDHVDRHRSFVLALGPWAKRGHVSKTHTSIMSILKTIYLIFGLGPNNMFDAAATDLRDMFTMDQDTGGYKSVDADPRVFVAKKAFDPNDPNWQSKRYMKPSNRIDDPDWLEKMRLGGG